VIAALSIAWKEGISPWRSTESGGVARHPGVHKFGNLCTGRARSQWERQASERVHGVESHMRSSACENEEAPPGDTDTFTYVN
jgi:hypothetical protein